MFTDEPFVREEPPRLLPLTFPDWAPNTHDQLLEMERRIVFREASQHAPHGRRHQVRESMERAWFSLDAASRPSFLVGFKRKLIQAEVRRLVAQVPVIQPIGVA